ncbi:MAG TPA: DUF1837 domain-containing protein [Thermoanaerobaculia bacterium]
MAKKSTSTAVVAPDIDLDAKIEKLLRHDGAGEFDAFIATVERDVAVPGTRARVHCNVVQLDGNGMPRVPDLARWLAYQIIDYVIPRQEIADAKAYDDAHNTSRRGAELHSKAKQLFARVANSGEGGELLLYVLAQTQLGLPQLFCKMPHKTNPKVHVHGIDGIHVGVNPDTGGLALYWGESKLHQTVGSAVTDALDSIKPFVCREGGSGAPYERDLQLMRDNIDLGDPELEEAMMRFLDRDDPKHNEVQFRGMCLVGFDHGCYPASHNEKEIGALIDEARAAMQEWVELVTKHIDKRPPLASIHLELFLIPFPSVEAFRAAFMHELTHA